LFEPRLLTGLFSRLLACGLSARLLFSGLLAGGLLTTRLLTLRTAAGWTSRLA
jgi:hypothetical protein